MCNIFEICVVALILPHFFERTEEGDVIDGGTTTIVVFFFSTKELKQREELVEVKLTQSKYLQSWAQRVNNSRQSITSLRNTVQENVTGNSE